MITNVSNIRALALRQGALFVPVKFNGQNMGRLQNVLEQGVGINPVVVQRLARLESFAFNLNNLVRIDLNDIKIPNVIPSSQMDVHVEMSRHPIFEQPRVSVHFSYQQSLTLGFITLGYDPYAKALSIYTCNDLEVASNQRLGMEVISRAVLTGAQVLRLLSLPIEYAYVFYKLGSCDYDPYDQERILPEIELDINRTFGVLSRIGFNPGAPHPTLESYNGAMSIKIRDLESKWQRDAWLWSQVVRLGEEFSSQLDQYEIEQRMFSMQDGVDENVQTVVNHWQGLNGHQALLSRGRFSENELTEIVLDKGLNSDIAARAFVELLLLPNLSRATKEKILQAIFGNKANLSKLDEEHLNRQIDIFLPTTAKLLIIADERFDWSVRMRLYFELFSRIFSPVHRKALTAKTIEVLKGLSFTQISELVINAMRQDDPHYSYMLKMVLDSRN